MSGNKEININEFLKILRQPIKIKNPMDDFKIIYICSDGKSFKGDEDAASKHETYLSEVRRYNRLSWLDKLFVKNPQQKK